MENSDCSDSKKIIRYLPFLGLIKCYKREYLVRDIIAGITVSVVLIPQSMSYAMIAGLPPVYGLYAACIPPIIAALFGKSSHLATGPVAIVSLLTFASILPYAKPGTPEFVAMAINLAAIVGIFQLIMGIFKMGFVMRFVSHPVIVGFTNAGAIIIATTQIKHFLGINIKDSEFIMPVFLDIAKNIIHTNHYTLLVGVVSLLIILVGKRIHKDFPGAMIAALLAIIASYTFRFDQYGVNLVGQMPAGMPSMHVPFVGDLNIAHNEGETVIGIKSYIDIETFLRLVGPGVVIAIVGFMEAMAITKSISARTKQPVDINQELIGQGTANLVGSFFQSFPTSGSFSRSAVNFQAGAKTALSNVFSGFIVIITLLFLTFTFTYLPKATLAAIVISAVVGLIKESQFVKLFKTNKNDGIIAIVTFSFAFLTKPDYAIFIGIALSLLLFLWESMYPRIVIMTRDTRAEVFVNAETKNLPTCPQILYIMPDFSIYFANAEYFKEHVIEIVRRYKDKTESDNTLKFILLDMEMVNKIDTTGLDEFKELIEELRKEGIEIYIANVKSPVRKTLENANFFKYLKQDRCYGSKADAITRLFNQIDYDYCRNKCPYKVFWECETIK